MIKDATCTFIVNKDYQVVTNCKVDTEYKDVFDFLVSPPDDLTIIEQYVTIDGKNYPMTTTDGWLCLYADY